MNFLSQLPIFSWIPQNIIDEIISSSQIETFNSWDIVFFQDDDSNGKWYIILEWKVWVIIDDKEISTLGVWDIFWEIALLNEESRTATIKALENTKTLIISQENIFEMINEWNESINKDIMERIEQNLWLTN